jgi:hypothetical protein
LGLESQAASDVVGAAAPQAVQSTPNTHAAPETCVAIAAHADWSVDPRKRWMSLAHRTGTGWILSAPRPVGDVGSLLFRLIEEAGGGAVALGVDLPIGLPRDYAATRPEAGFRAFLGNVDTMPDFFAVCASLDEIRPDRPPSIPSAGSPA